MKRTLSTVSQHMATRELSGEAQLDTLEAQQAAADGFRRALDHCLQRPNTILGVALHRECEVRGPVRAQ